MSSRVGSAVKPATACGISPIAAGTVTTVPAIGFTSSRSLRRRRGVDILPLSSCVTDEFPVVAAPVSAYPRAFVANTVADLGPRAHECHSDGQQGIPGAKDQRVLALRTRPRVA